LLYLKDLNENMPMNRMFLHKKRNTFLSFRMAQCGAGKRRLVLDYGMLRECRKADCQGRTERKPRAGAKARQVLKQDLRLVRLS
jgi:hypothetical protein